MGWIDGLFSFPSTAEKVTDAVISTGDKLFFTDEEKAEYRKEQREFFPTLLKAYQPFKLAQRVLALWFAFLYGIAFLVGMLMVMFNAYVKYEALKAGVDIESIILLDLTPLYALVGAFSVGTIMAVIVGFYFGGGVIDSLKRKGE